jgi:hypothetical protein
MRRIVVGIVMAGALAAPLRAELKYTMHLEAHKATVPVTVDPLLGMAADMIIGMLLPNGPTDTVCTVGDRGVRMESNKPVAGVPEGGYILQKPDGSMFVVDPAKKTYWKLQVRDMSALFGSFDPKVTIKKTTETATIAGIKAEKVQVDVALPVPVPPGVALPPGMPTEIIINQELWTTPQFEKYKGLMSGVMKALGVSGFGGKVTVEGFTLRQIMRGGPYGDQEIEMVITKIAEESVPASTFEIPADYKEVSGGGL